MYHLDVYMENKLFLTLKTYAAEGNIQALKDALTKCSLGQLQKIESLCKREHPNRAGAIVNEHCLNEYSRRCPLRGIR